MKTRGCVNHVHLWLCRSGRWQKTIEQRVLWVVSGANLGQNVVELGAGPGLTKDLLRLMLERLTAKKFERGKSVRRPSTFSRLAV